MKASASKDLLLTVCDAFRGIPFPSTAGGASRQQPSREIDTQASAGPALTRRQTKVLQLIGEGHSTKAIAGILSLSTKTVEKHRQLLMDKLDIHEVATLTRYAIASGIVESKTCAELLGRGRGSRGGGAGPLPTRLRRVQGNLELPPGKGSGGNGAGNSITNL